LKTINNNIGKVIKFISIKLYGGRLKEVNIPRKKGNNENKNK
tara:strand:- start:340 stop:465 length:126 start_codon:yes stop_codon:yes gene_type:complete